MSRIGNYPQAQETRLTFLPLKWFWYDRKRYKTYKRILKIAKESAIKESTLLAESFTDEEIKQSKK